MLQTTIARTAAAEGVGLHTGVHGRIRLVPAPADTGIVFRRVDLDTFLIKSEGQGEGERVGRPKTFRPLLARARTFCSEREIEPLRSMGLIRGGSLENAIVLTNDGVMTGPLRFPDEFGRHKALDLIGDLALAGLPLLARVEAHKAGHALHTQLVSRLLADPTLWTVTTPEPLHDQPEPPLAPFPPLSPPDYAF